MQKKDRKVPRLTAFFLITLYRFQGSLKETGRPKFHPEPTSKEAGSRYGKWVEGDSPRTLTTAYERKDEIKRLVISVQFNDEKSLGKKRLVLGESTKKSSLQEHRADAQAPYAEEGRGQLRKAVGSRKQALIHRFPNGETRRESCPVTHD